MAQPVPVLEQWASPQAKLRPDAETVLTHGSCDAGTDFPQLWYRLQDQQIPTTSSRSLDASVEYRPLSDSCPRASGPAPPQWATSRTCPGLPPGRISKPLHREPFESLVLCPCTPVACLWRCATHPVPLMQEIASLVPFAQHPPPRATYRTRPCHRRATQARMHSGASCRVTRPLLCGC